MTKNYTFHSDPGHGWLEVPIADVRASGAEISSYSYYKNGVSYLEEDCDAPAFIRGMENKGIKIEIADVQHDNRCFIRGLGRFPKVFVAS